MADTSTIEIKVEGLRGSYIPTNTGVATGENAKVNVTESSRAAVTHQLSRLEQIVEYLKVLYR